MDPIDLLAVAYQTGGPPGREAAAAGLMPVIRRSALRVTRNGTRRDRARFVDGAPQYILAGREAEGGFGRPPIRSFDPTRGRFTTWVCRVLRNRWIDQVRRDLRQPPPPPLPDDRPEVPRWGGGGRVLEGRAWPFGTDDLGAIGGWPPARRVELLVMAGTWPKVPAAVWAGWVEEYRGPNGRPLPRPFPPADWDPNTPREVLTNRFTGLLGYAPSYLPVVWHRERGRLAELRFFRWADDPRDVPDGP